MASRRRRRETTAPPTREQHNARAGSTPRTSPRRRRRPGRRQRRPRGRRRSPATCPPSIPHSSRRAAPASLVFLEAFRPQHTKLNDRDNAGTSRATSRPSRPPLGLPMPLATRQLWTRRSNPPICQHTSPRPGRARGRRPNRPQNRQQRRPTRLPWTPVWKSTSASGALARSSGEEPASTRHRAGVASMAWRSTRQPSTNAP